MTLYDLDTQLPQARVILLQTSSKSLETFVYDKVKGYLSCTQDTVLQVESKKDLQKVREVMNIQPPFAKRWLVQVNLPKLKSAVKELLPIIRESSTVMYFCIADKYVQFKNFKQSLKGQEGVLDFYINVLRRKDFLYLYNSLVPEDKRLTKQLYDYVVQSYSADIAAVFELIRSLQSGVKFKTRTEIAEVCGVGGNSIESFVFSLLKDPPTTARGLTTVVRNRLKAGAELAEIYGWSRLNNLLRSCLNNILDIKMLAISGKVYKSLQGLPKGYDEKKLSRYQRYLWKIKQIPLSRVLRLRTCISSRWTSQVDYLRDMYLFIKDIEVYEVVPNLKVESAEDDYIKAQQKLKEEEAKQKRELYNQRKAERLKAIDKFGYVSVMSRVKGEQKCQ